MASRCVTRDARWEDASLSIHKLIGRRPILAFGNSDGDLQMLQWTAAGGGSRFMGVVHHTDAAANPQSAASTKPSTRQTQKVGRSWT
jgi:hypothetical protein